MEMKRLARFAAILAIIITLISTGCPNTSNNEEQSLFEYNIHISTTENGTIETEFFTAVQKQRVTLTITPDEGYRLKESSLTVKQTDETSVTISGSGNTRTFIMPASDVTVSGEFEKQPYSVTVQAGITNGSITANAASAVMGDTITLTITSDEGYILRETILSVKQTDGTDVTISGSGATRTFTMPSSNVTVSGEFGIRYSITVQTAGIANGSVSANPIVSASEDPITLTITPNEGYYLKANGLSVKQTNGTTVPVIGPGRIRTFIMPASDVTVTVVGEFEVSPTNNISINFEDLYEENINLTGDHNNDLVIGSNQTLTMTVPADYENYYWYINGTPQNSDSNSFTVAMDAWDTNTIGIHNITVVVQKDGIPYSKSLTFKVVL